MQLLRYMVYIWEDYEKEMEEAAAFTGQVKERKNWKRRKKGLRISVRQQSPLHRIMMPGKSEKPCIIKMHKEIWYEF